MTIFGVTFNYADLAVVGIFLIAAIIGFCRGLLINIVNFIRISVGLFLCFYLSNYGAQPLYEKFIRPRCMEAINEKIVTSGNIDEVISNLNEFTAGLPGFLSSAFNIKSLDITSADIAESIMTGVFEPVLLFLAKAVIFIAVFIVFFLATAVIIRLAVKASKKRDEKRGHQTLAKKTDKLLGLVFGLLKASIIVLAIISVLMYILSLKPELAEQNSFWAQISAGRLIKILNEINPFNAVTEGYI